MRWWDRLRLRRRPLREVPTTFVLASGSPVVHTESVVYSLPRTRAQIEADTHVEPDTLDRFLSTLEDGRASITGWWDAAPRGLNEGDEITVRGMSFARDGVYRIEHVDSDSDGSFSARVQYLRPEGT